VPTKESDKLLDFVANLAGNSWLKVEKEIGEGLFVLKIGEAERRQAKHDIRCVEDVVVELVRNSRDEGIGIISSNDNMVIGNTVSGNTWGIVLVEGSSRNIIMSNRARGNTQYDLFDDGTGTGNVWKLNSYDTKNW